MRGLLPFLLFLFILAALLRLEFYFNLLYLLAGVYLLSRLWVGRGLERVQVARRFVPRAFLGEEVAVELEVQNTGRLPVPWLELNESLPVQLSVPPFSREVISLRGQERRRLGYTLHCRRRGYFPLGPLTIRTGDLLGLLGTRSRTLEPSHLIVYPKVVPLHELGLPTHSPLALLPARTPLFEDPSRVRGVRDYQHGDSPRRIHWRATASTGRLLVKQLQPAIAHEAMLFLDLEEEAYERGSRFTATELAIVVAASLANHIIGHEGMPAGLATWANDPLVGEARALWLPPRRERANLMQILETLARVEPVTNAPLAARLRAETARLGWGTTLVVITGSLGEALMGALLTVRRAGSPVVLVLVQDNQPGPELQRHAAALQMPIHRVWDERDLETWG